MRFCQWGFVLQTASASETQAAFSLTPFYEAHVDTKNKVVTTPAFMCETELHNIFDGIGAMVKNVLKLTGK